MLIQKSNSPSEFVCSVALVLRLVCHISFFVFKFLIPNIDSLDKCHTSAFSTLIIGWDKKHYGTRRKHLLPVSSPFPTMFSKSCFPRFVRSVDCEVKVKSVKYSVLVCFSITSAPSLFLTLSDIKEGSTTNITFWKESYKNACLTYISPLINFP